MIDEHSRLIDPRMQTAVDELQQLIRSHFPTTTFTVGEAEDPEGMYVRAIVDVDDTDEVMDVFIDRMIDLQVNDGLPIYVVPVRTPERIADLDKQEHNGRWRLALTS